MTLDEVERAPEVLGAVKRAIDRSRTPGRFLLTASANLLLVRRVSESLAGPEARRHRHARISRSRRRRRPRDRRLAGSGRAAPRILAGDRTSYSLHANIDSQPGHSENGPTQCRWPLRYAPVVACRPRRLPPGPTERRNSRFSSSSTRPSTSASAAGFFPDAPPRPATRDLDVLGNPLFLEEDDLICPPVDAVICARAGRV